jgi:hypothetical protein
VSGEIVGQAVRLSREQAENLIRYPELLARTIDMLRAQLDYRIDRLTGTSGEFIDVMILAETVILTDEEDQ